MNLVLGIMFLFAGAGCMWVASHGIEARTPWGVWQTILSRVDKAGEA